MILTTKQKNIYINMFDDCDYKDYLKRMINYEWEVKYDPKPNDYEYALLFAEEEIDRLSRRFVEEELR